MESSRRFFLKASSGAMLGLYLSPLGCERNAVTPKFSGGRFDFLTTIDSGLSRSERLPDTHFVQFGAAGSVQGWRYDDIAQVSRDDWQIELTGDVATPTTLTFSDIDAQVDANEDITVVSTLRCIIDATSIPGLVGTALWRGVPLARFLEPAGVGAGVRRFRIFGRDGFRNNLLVSELTVDPDRPERSPLLAFEVNGEAVPHIHGGPVRLLVPGKYGFKSLKWVDRIEATDSDEVFGSYQEVFGFFDDGTIQMATKVTDPLAEATLSEGEIDLFGYALSGSAAIQSVEVSIDDEPFAPAEIEPLDNVLSQNPSLADALQVQAGRSYPFQGVWTLFRFRWQATPGSHRLRFRALDQDGNVQVERDEDVSNGSDGYWDIRVDVSNA